jgi:hypothetical protein
MTARNTGDDATQGQTTDQPVVARLERQAWLPDEDAMSLAVHKVYCGIMADHEHPSDKDRDQARQLIAAMRQAT